jgi:hypothetical protein
LNRHRRSPGSKCRLPQSTRVLRKVHFSASSGGGPLSDKPTSRDLARKQPFASGFAPLKHGMLSAKLRRHYDFPERN